MVRECHRLGMLQMRAAGHDGVLVGFGLRDDRVDDAQDVAGDRARVIEQIHAHECRDLVVAAAAGAELAAELGTDDRDERLFEGTVHVFVGRTGAQCSVGDAARQHVEALVHGTLLLGGEIAGRGERLRVCVRTGDVIQREHPVEVRGAAQRGELR